MEIFNVIDNRTLTLWYVNCRIISNYEHNEGDFVFINTILEDASAKDVDFTIDKIAVGHVINRIWGGKVKKDRSSLNGGTRYQNLRKRTVIDSETKIIQALDEETVKSITQLCCRHDEWRLESAKNGQFKLIKVPFSGQEGTTIDDLRLVYEITATLDPPNITVRAHGQSVSFEEFNHSVTVSAVDTIIRLVDTTSLCLGKAVSLVLDDNVESSMNYLKFPVAGSKLVSISTAEDKKEMRLMSTSCLVLTSGTLACKNCTYVAKLWNNRETKRKTQKKGWYLDLFVDCYCKSQLLFPRIFNIINAWGRLNTLF